MLRVVARREIHALFRSPLAWMVLASTQFVLAFQFLAQIDIFQQYLPKLRSLPVPPGVTQVVVVPTFGMAAMVLLFVIPVITMHSLSAERRAGTLALWYSAPVSLTALVLGKFLGVMSLLLVVWALNALMPLTLLWGTALDLGTYAAGLLGLLLLMAACTALGLFFSAATSQPTVAALATFALLLSLWLIDWASRLNAEPGLLAQLSMLNHFQHLAGGLIDSTAVAYFLIVIASALALTIWRLYGDRQPL